MNLEEVSISNFKRFNGDEVKNCIDFRVTKNKPLSIVAGKNGIGKSTVWEAVTWAFFGKHLIEDRVKEAKKMGDDWSLVTPLTPAYIEAKKNSQKTFPVKVSVDISLDPTEFENVKSNFSDKESNKFNITRTMIVKFKEDTSGAPHWDYLKELKTNYSDIVAISQQTKSGWVPLDANNTVKQEFIHSFAPLGIRKYYFFDAANEDIVSLSSDPLRVKEAVQQLSGITKAGDLILMIEKYQREVQIPGAKDFTDIKNELTKIIDTHNRMREKLLPRIQSFDSEKRGLKNSIAELEVALKNSKFSEKKTARINELKIENGEKNQFINEQTRILKEKLAINLPLILGQKLFKNLQGSIKKEVDQGKWPEGLRLEDIDNLERILKEKELLSKSIKTLKLSIKESEKFVANLIKNLKNYLIEMNQIKQKGVEISDLPRRISTILATIPDNQENIQDISKLISSKENELNNNEREIQEIYSEMNIKEGELAHIGKTSRRLEEDQEALTKLEQQNKLDKDEFLRIRGVIDHNEKEKQKLEDKEAGSNIEIDRFRAMTELKQHLEEQINVFEDANRIEINKNMNDSLTKIFGKEKVYNNIDINERYSLMADKGAVNIGSQSRGQRLSIALTFVLGLIKSSGASPPLLIDAPTAHIDGDRALSLFQCYKENSHQTVCFMMPGREIGAGKEETKYLLANCNSICTLELGSNGAISIKEGYHP
jgi:DNA sulfur modification protein DndD